MKIEFCKQRQSQEATILFVDNASNMGACLKGRNKDEYIANALKNTAGFEGKEGQYVHILLPRCCDAKHLFVVSVGKKEEVTPLSMRRVGAKIADLLNGHKLEIAELMVDDLGELIDNKDAAVVDLLFGIKLKNYSFNKYFEVKKESHKLYLNKVIVVCEDEAEIARVHADITTTADGVMLARDLVSEPPNRLNPIEFMHRCKLVGDLGVKVTVLNKERMAELGMNALLGVAQGSAAEPYAVVMEWNPSASRKNRDKTLALVGKGVCFDSGGINIKPSAGMSDMKYDMAGAAAVVGAMHAIAARKADAHVVGIVGLVENMPSGSAQRPSDIVTSMSGQTIEIGDTDAEGRLVLADIMCYVQQHYKITHMVDIATLTGAIVVALGETYAGLFSNDKGLIDQLRDVGEEVGELLWPMPLHTSYDSQIDSPIADISNIGIGGRGGGSCTAAQFLQRFVRAGCIWAHLDIAGLAWNKNGTPLAPKGATGFGVQLFDAFVKRYIE